MSELSNEEMKACVPTLLKKLVENRPKWVPRSASSPSFRVLTNTLSDEQDGRFRRDEDLRDRFPTSSQLTFTLDRFSDSEQKEPEEAKTCYAKSHTRITTYHHLSPVGG